MAQSGTSHEEHGPELTVQEARQGRSGRPVVVVLVVSTLLVVLAFAAIWLYHAPGLSGPGGGTRVAASVGSTAAMPARQKPEQPGAPTP